MAKIAPRSRFCSSVHLKIEKKAKFTVYFLLSGDSVVYVGSSIFIDQRINQHLSQNKKEFDKVRYYHCSSEDEMKRMEVCEILYWSPKYNKLTPEITAYGYSTARSFRLKYKNRPPIRKVKMLIKDGSVDSIEFENAEWFCRKEMEEAYLKVYGIELQRVSK